MNAFTFERLSRQTDAASAVAAHLGAIFLAGGTTLVDLMKVNVLTPDTVVNVRHLGLSTIDVSDQAIAVGAAVTNVSWRGIRSCAIACRCFGAIVSGATTQIRNMATVAGNILQRRAASISQMCTRRSRKQRVPSMTSTKLRFPTLLMHGVRTISIVPHPSDLSSRKSASTLIKGAVEIYYPGLPHGLTATHADVVNRDLLAFCQQDKRKVA